MRDSSWRAGFALLRQSVISSSIIVAALAPLACGGDEGPTNASQAMDLTGTWNFTDSLLNWSSFRTKTCTSGRGVLTITQTGTTFSGSLTDDTGCIADTTGLGLRAGPISAGVISGDQVSFEVAFCKYVATTSGGSPPTRMTGTETCLLHYGITDSTTYDGDWQASR